MSEEPKRIRRRVAAPRQLLLVEVERYCRDASCGARNRVGLTKEEARVYAAFTCERCEREWPDALDEGDVPEWWEELQVTSLGRTLPAPSVADETAGPVGRMSEAWRAVPSDTSREPSDGGASS